MGLIYSCKTCKSEATLKYCIKTSVDYKADESITGCVQYPEKGFVLYTTFRCNNHPLDDLILNNPNYEIKIGKGQFRGS